MSLDHASLFNSSTNSGQVFPKPATKRLKLAISYDPAQSGLAFTLSELMGKHRVFIKKEIVRVSRETLISKGERWQNTLEQCEEQFRDSCNELYERLSTEAIKKGVDEKDVPAYVYSHAGWSSAVDEASISLADDIGRHIVDFSDDLLAELLPNENTQFCRLFNEELDIPTMQAYESGKPHAWLNMPLLQIRVDRDVLCLPWWLSRTYDKKSLWCCRYALAVSPTLDDTDPPAILLEQGGGVHILSITRPTSDLRPWLPISNETTSAAYPFVSNGLLTWRLLDGVFGDHLLGDPSKLSEKIERNSDFKGVSKRLVRNALRSAQNRPNLIVYQGHWVNYKFESATEEPPFLFLNDGHNERFKKPRGHPAFSGPILPVPILNLIPSNNSDKILIMNACSSGAAINQSRLIEKYVQARSVFIGANYPLLANLSGPSVDVLMGSILRNQYLAHAVSEVNWLLTDLNNDSPDTREVFQKAGLCVFGDVRTSLRAEFDAEARDNLTTLQIKLTDRWAAGLERLGLKHYTGMTFRTAVTDISPAHNFALTDGGVKLALAPLVVAIDLCNQEDGYVILGPAFSSRESVALISTKFDNLQTFMREIDLRRERNQQITLGLLAKRLTSTYMTELFLKQQMLKSYQSSIVEEVWEKLIRRQFAYQGKGTGIDKLAEARFLSQLDISLALNKSRSELTKLGHIIAEDLETTVVDILGLKGNILPRGILLTRKKSLEAETERLEIIEFCNDFNRRVDEGLKSASVAGDGAPDDIALYTYDRAEAEYLHAIHKFAHTEFFADRRNFGWENFAYRPKTEVSINEIKDLITDLGEVSWSKDSLLDMELDSRPSARGLQALQQDLHNRLDSQPFWSITPLQNILDEALDRSSLIQVYKDDLHKYFTMTILRMKNSVIPV